MCTWMCIYMPGWGVICPRRLSHKHISSRLAIPIALADSNIEIHLKSSPALAMAASALPSHHRALILESTSQPLRLTTVPTPTAHPGSAIISVLSAGVISYQREIYNGTRAYTLPTPLVPGLSAIGRIVALGPDAVSLSAGQLVFFDCTIRARDDPATVFLLGIHDGGAPRAKKLAREVWRNGTFAEYARVPLENCIPLDEARLRGELGYTVHDLMYMGYLMVPFGGLRDIAVEAGETVVVSPATGGYGGAAVMVALAMGARVIAFGRNEWELERLKGWVGEGARVETVRITGEEAVDAEALKRCGTIDKAIDFTPPQGKASSHVRSVVHAMRKGGKISLMGLNENPIVPWSFIGKNIELKGKLMYEREDMVQFVKMLEGGLFPKGAGFADTKVFPLEDWKACLDAAAEHTGIGKSVVFAP